MAPVDVTVSVRTLTLTFRPTNLFSPGISDFSVDIKWFSLENPLFLEYETPDGSHVFIASNLLAWIKVGTEKDLVYRAVPASDIEMSEAEEE